MPCAAISFFLGEREHRPKLVVPSNSSKSLANVQHEKQSYLFISVEATGKVSDVHDVNVDTSLLYECTLGIGSDVVHERS